MLSSNEHISKRASHLEVIWNSVARDYIQESVVVYNVVLVEKAWYVVVLEGYIQYKVGFIVCSVQMNMCLKGHPIGRSFGTEQQAIMFGKSVKEEEKNVWIRKREKEESALVVWCTEAQRKKRETMKSV